MGRTYRKRRHNQKPCEDANAAHSAHNVIGRLTQFCLSLGCSNVKNLRPYNFHGSGRGLQTLSTISPGHTLISVPPSLLITTSVALRVDELKCAIERSSLKPTASVLMTAFLLLEKSQGDKSYWHHYIASLPNTFTTLLYINPLDLDVLDDSLQDNYKSMTNRIRREFEEMKNIFPSVSRISLDEFMWAWHVVNTRCVFMKQPTLSQVRTTPDSPDNFALVPFLDLLNHSPTAKVNYGYNELKNCFEIITHDSYARYDQVYIAYSSHSNRALLSEYGFCISNNIDDLVTFEFDDLVTLLIPDRLDLHEQLKELFLSKGLLCDGNGFSWNLLEAIKVICRSMDGSLTELQCREKITSKYAGERLACLNKIDTCRHLHQRTEEENFILDMLTLLYQNEVKLLNNSVGLERNHPECEQTLDQVFAGFSTIDVEL